MGDLIQIEHLSKRFGDVQAVDDLSFRVKEGELFAFLGVNGAGKSTTINILCGQLAKDRGTVTIGGTDLDTDASSIKRSLGVVFQSSVLERTFPCGTICAVERRFMASVVMPSGSDWQNWQSC